jgi:hypothetical protein
LAEIVQGHFEFEVVKCRAANPENTSEDITFPRDNAKGFPDLESGRSDMKPYRFLLDRDVSKAASLFPARRTRTIAEVGLAENTKDAAVVERAWELEATIVTANGDDFLREARKFLRSTKRNDCHDLFGLVILPNKYEIQKRTLDELGSRLRFRNSRISWDEVWRQNLCVRVKTTGNPEVTQLPRCFYCQKASAS